MAAKKRRRKRKKKIEASKKLAYWAASVATLSAASSLLLSAFGRDPVGELTGTIFTACVGYLITYAGKSLGEKISRNRHGLDADGNPLPDPSGDTLNNEEAKEGGKPMKNQNTNDIRLKPGETITDETLDELTGGKGDDNE